MGERDLTEEPTDIIEIFEDLIKFEESINLTRRGKINEALDRVREIKDIKYQLKALLNVLFWFSLQMRHTYPYPKEYVQFPNVIEKVCREVIEEIKNKPTSERLAIIKCLLLEGLKLLREGYITISMGEKLRKLLINTAVEICIQAPNECFNELREILAQLTQLQQCYEHYERHYDELAYIIFLIYKKGYNAKATMMIDTVIDNISDFYDYFKFLSSLRELQVPDTIVSNRTINKILNETIKELNNKVSRLPNQCLTYKSFKKLVYGLFFLTTYTNNCLSLMIYYQYKNIKILTKLLNIIKKVSHILNINLYNIDLRIFKYISKFDNPVSFLGIILYDLIIAYNHILKILKKIQKYENENILFLERDIRIIRFQIDNIIKNLLIVKDKTINNKEIFNNVKNYIIRSIDEILNAIENAIEDENERYFVLKPKQLVLISSPDGCIIGWRL